MAMSKEERKCMIVMGDAISVMSNNILKIGKLITKSDTDSIFACGLCGGMSTGKNMSSFTDRSIKIPADVENCVINVMKKHSNFTDGSMSKEPIKIPENKYWGFVNSLRESSKKKLSLNKAMYFRWNTDGEYTKCFVEYDSILYIGTASKHPSDVENEYIGKSLSFNRAFDKLEKAVLGIGDEKVVGTALTTAFEDNYVNVRGNGFITRCIAGADIDIGDAVYVGHGGRVYPANSKQKGYRGGRTENSKIKSESMLNLTYIQDDITITMTREQAEILRKHLGTQNNVAYDTFHELGIKLGLVER